jgi:hypothetical protein
MEDWATYSSLELQTLLPDVPKFTFQAPRSWNVELIGASIGRSYGHPLYHVRSRPYVPGKPVGTFISLDLSRSTNFADAFELCSREVEGSMRLFISSGEPAIPQLVNCQCQTLRLAGNPLTTAQADPDFQSDVNDLPPLPPILFYYTFLEAGKGLIWSVHLEVEHDRDTVEQIVCSLGPAPATSAT